MHQWCARERNWPRVEREWMRIWNCCCYLCSHSPLSLSLSLSITHFHTYRCEWLGSLYISLSLSLSLCITHFHTYRCEWLGSLYISLSLSLSLCITHFHTYRCEWLGSRYLSLSLPTSLFLAGVYRCVWKSMDVLSDSLSGVSIFPCLSFSLPLSRSVMMTLSLTRCWDENHSPSSRYPKSFFSFFVFLFCLLYFIFEAHI